MHAIFCMTVVPTIFSKVQPGTFKIDMTSIRHFSLPFVNSGVYVFSTGAMGALEPAILGQSINGWYGGK